ncbi:MAG TPA: BatA domain-containing protein [bacterium]|nr:BatA domain-containing protein [bacterium]
MNFTFLHPKTAALLPLILLPVLLHLLLKRKAVLQPFPTLLLLTRVNRSQNRFWRLREILLLVLRTGMLFFLILFFARPLVLTGKKNAAGKKNLVFVDRSYSMDLRQEGKSLREKAGGVLEGIGNTLSGEKTEFYFYDDTAERYFPGNSGGGDLAVPDSFRTTDISCISEILEKSRDSRVIILSDFCKHGFSGPKAPELFREREVFCLLLGTEKKNHALLDIPELWLNEKNDALIYFFTKGEKGEKIPLTAFVEKEKRYSGLLELSEEKERSKIGFRNRSGAPYISGFLELGTDALQEDNLRFFSRERTLRKKIAILNGEPSGIYLKDEVYYLKTLLEVETGKNLPWEAEVFAREQFEAFFSEIEDFHLVILANVDVLTPPQVLALSKRKLMIFAGDNFLKGNYRDWRFLPAQAGPAVDAKKNMSLSGKDLFSGAEENGRSIPVTRFLKLSPFKNTETLLETEDGDPLAVMQDNRTVFFAFPADRDWTDFPLYPEFLSVRNLLLRFLKDEKYKTEYSVGEQLVWASETRPELISPKGRTIPFTGMISASGTGWKSETLEEPGLYLLSAEKQKAAVPVAVNLTAASESELEKLDFSSFFKKAHFQKLEIREGWEKRFNALVKGREIGTLLLTLLGLFFAGEMFLALYKG